MPFLWYFCGIFVADSGMAWQDDAVALPQWCNPPMSSLKKTTGDLSGRKVIKGGCVAVTAPTGIAAVNVGGVTIHSFSGIGLGQVSHRP